MPQEQGHQEQEDQERDHSSGYQDQTAYQKKASTETEQRGERQPMNGYEFWLEGLKWVEKNWPFVLIFCNSILILLIELLHLLTHIVTGK